MARSYERDTTLDQRGAPRALASSRPMWWLQVKLVADLGLAERLLVADRGGNAELGGDGGGGLSARRSAG